MESKVWYRCGFDKDDDNPKAYVGVVEELSDEIIQNLHRKVVKVYWLKYDRYDPEKRNKHSGVRQWPSTKQDWAVREILRQASYNYQPWSEVDIESLSCESSLYRNILDGLLRFSDNRVTYLNQKHFGWKHMYSDINFL